MLCVLDWSCGKSGCDVFPSTLADLSENGASAVFDDIDNEDVYTLTGTVDYALTDHLTGRMELRYDNASFSSFGPGGAPFAVRDNGAVKDDIVLGVIEMVYTF